MIARHDVALDKNDIWSKLAAEVPVGAISWRQDGRPINRDGKHFARFVCYIDAQTVRERLDTVVPGEWDLTLELLPTITNSEGEQEIAFKARLQILGVIREDVGTGRDYKSAATDAFKRAAVRFGIGHELYQYEQNWVQVDGDGRFAKPLEDPSAAYARRHGSKQNGASARARVERVERAEAAEANEAPEATERPVKARKASAPKAEVVAAEPVALETSLPVETPVGPLATEEQSCPKCGGRMWDNRATKRNPKAPDFKCRDRSCDGVVWPARANGNGAAEAPRSRSSNGAEPLVPEHDEVSVGSDDLPF
jgi:hypothetical protein